MHYYGAYAPNCLSLPVNSRIGVAQNQILGEPSRQFARPLDSNHLGRKNRTNRTIWLIEETQAVPAGLLLLEGPRREACQSGPGRHRSSLRIADRVLVQEKLDSLRARELFTLGVDDHCL